MGGSNDKTFTENVSDNWKDFKEFLWDDEDKLVMGRTFIQWCQLITFYIFFYFGLAAFFVGLLAFALIFIIPENQPMFTRYLTHGGPGLNVVPRQRNNAQRITYKRSDQKSFEFYTSSINEFLTDYAKSSKYYTQKPARSVSTSDDSTNADNYAEPKKNESTGVSYFNLFNLGECYGDTAGSDYGFSSAKPCIFFRMNKIYGFTPKEFDIDELERMDGLKREQFLDSVGAIGDEGRAGFINMGCSGYNPSDKENIQDISYFPKAGFDVGNFYPWKAQTGWQAPILAAKFAFKDPSIKTKVTCRLSARNIYIHRNLKNIGQTSIEFQIKE